MEIKETNLLSDYNTADDNGKQMLRALFPDVIFLNNGNKQYHKHPEWNKAFKAGVEWQRNHVWHKTSDIPEPGKRCLVEYKDGDGNICISIDWRTEYEWVNDSHYDKIFRWVYIDDITPTSFDEILEENKDVLQRLKDK